ncbi:hypothetical protein GGI16_000246 [Coemansia sp. S142-1]|nr:hypothetical protein GGI16_000246 [Coemansia sp. S142-1]
MRFAITLPAILCLLSLCQSRRVGISNLRNAQAYDINDTECHIVDPWFTGNTNQVQVSGSHTPAQIYSNNDCTDMVGIVYMYERWIPIPKPIRLVKFV